MNQDTLSAPELNGGDLPALKLNECQVNERMLNE